ncbi:MAG TPA: hypothetical protein ENJ72_04155 [Thermodesulfatator sp.]|nr:hypothetical protein [Thermodesulfatator sp.]
MMKVWKPTAEKRILFLTCGLLWLMVGIYLMALAWYWFRRFGYSAPALLAMVGLLLAYYLGFVRIARKNIGRLRAKPQRICFFAFQSWKSYLIVAIMIALGATLRHSSIPKIWLAPLYMGIGGALSLASLCYFRQIL